MEMQIKQLQQLQYKLSSTKFEKKIDFMLKIQSNEWNLTYVIVSKLMLNWDKKNEVAFKLSSLEKNILDIFNLWENEGSILEVT